MGNAVNSLLPLVQMDPNQSILAQMSNGQLPANLIVQLGENYATGSGAGGTGPVQGGNRQGTLMRSLSRGTVPANQSIFNQTPQASENGDGTGLVCQVSQIVASIAGTVLTVTAIKGLPALGEGVNIYGQGVAQGTVIISAGSGTGGVGTYNINISQTVASTTMSPAMPFGG